MPNTPSHVIIAGLGPFAELLGVFVLVALFTLLRGQADRRPYFKAWEESWVMLAVAMLAGVIYQRLTDPDQRPVPGQRIFDVALRVRLPRVQVSRLRSAYCRRTAAHGGLPQSSVRQGGGSGSSRALARRRHA
jgi:hypothetical protein